MTQSKIVIDSRIIFVGMHNLAYTIIIFGMFYCSNAYSSMSNIAIGIMEQQFENNQKEEHKEFGQTGRRRQETSFLTSIVMTTWVIKLSTKMGYQSLHTTT